jgi:hypothetical protein
VDQRPEIPIAGESRREMGGGGQERGDGGRERDPRPATEKKEEWIEKIEDELRVRKKPWL